MRTIYYIIISCFLIALINSCSKERGPVIGEYNCSVRKSSFYYTDSPHVSITYYNENIRIKRHWTKKIEVFGEAVTLDSNKTFKWDERPANSSWGFRGSFFSDDSLCIYYYSSHGQENISYKGKKVD